MRPNGLQAAASPHNAQTSRRLPPPTQLQGNRKRGVCVFRCVVVCCAWITDLAATLPQPQVVQAAASLHNAQTSRRLLPRCVVAVVCLFGVWRWLCVGFSMASLWLYHGSDILRHASGLQPTDI